MHDLDRSTVSGDSPAAIGRRLRERRLELGLSQRDLALETGAVSDAEELARLVLETEGQPLPQRAVALAKRVLRER